MKEWVGCLAISSAIIVGLMGFYLGVWSYSYGSIVTLQHTIVAVIIPLCAPLSLFLGTETWKRKKGFSGYVTFLATSGIAGAALGLSLMFWVLD